MKVMETFKADLHHKKAKSFLYKLYLLDADKKFSRKRAKLINEATSFQLNTLLKALHYIANGAIPVRKSKFKRIRQSGNFPSLVRKLRNESDLRNMLAEAKSEKCHFLRKYNVYHHLLFNLFNLP